MKTNQPTIFAAVHAMCWIVFLGLCIKTGAILISFAVSLFVNPAGAQDLYLGLDLSGLLKLSKSLYVSMVTLVLALWSLKAYMAYLVIRLFSTVNPEHPFRTAAARLITKISEVAVGTGVLAILANAYAKWLSKQAISLQGLSQYLDSGGEILFLAGILFVIAQIYRKGVELQSESELTV